MKSCRNHVPFGAVLVFCVVSFGFSSQPSLAQENNHPPKGFTALFNGHDFDNWTGSITKDPRNCRHAA